MLRRLLEAVRTGRAGDTRDLAREVGVPPAVVAAMMDELARRGLVQRTGDCRSACADCAVGGICGSRLRGGAWVLTRAGREHAAP